MSYENAVPNTQPVPPEHLTLTQTAVLRRAVAKLLVIGEQVGVSSDQMISLLQSGLTVRELLDYLAAREQDII